MTLHRTSRFLAFLGFCLVILLPPKGTAAPIGWEANFGTPLGTLTGQDEAEQNVGLSFAFPLANASYSSVWVSTNGHVNLGMTANNPCCASVPDFVNSTSPIVAPFYTDLDLLDQGTIYFNDLGNRAVVTWDRVGSYASPSSPFTFQLRLDAAGTIAFSYFGISNTALALDGDLIAGVSPGNGASDPGSSNFLFGPVYAGNTTVYQNFSLGGAPFDLDNSTVTFRPAGSGFDVSVSQVPEPRTTILLIMGLIGVGLWRLKKSISFRAMSGVAAIVACAALLPTASAAQDGQVGRQGDGSFLLPTGQPIAPVGDHIEVNDRPLGMVVSPDGSLLAVATGSNFNPNALHIIDLPSKTLRQTIPIAGSFVGVDFTKDGKTLYVGGGTSNSVLIFTRNEAGQFAANGSIAIPASAPSGLRLNGDDSRLYVALNLKGALAVIDTARRTVVTQVAVGTYPYTAEISRDGGKVYVSNWGGRVPGPNDMTDGTFPVVVDPRTGIPASGTVSVIDTGSNQVVKTIDVGLHPCGMALSPGGDRLYVTNANSDTVSVIDTAADTVSRVLTVTLSTTKVGQTKVPELGSSPNAIAVSPDGGTLYVANGSDNAIAVVDPRTPATNPVRGLIPAGWYPMAVATSKTGEQIYIADGYGFGSVAPVPAGTGRSYADRKGVISILNVPSSAELGEFTRLVRQSNRTLPPGGAGIQEAGNPIPQTLGGSSPIHHVFYIIKENRTYDQVFGDLPQGNGDASLVEFGREVTPNQHALAEKYVLLDNYYGPGDQSALGHRWCLQAYPSDWMHKYSNGRNDQNPMILGATEAIYDNAKEHGVSVHSFGERGLNTFSDKNATWTDIYNDWKNKTDTVQITPRAEIVGLRSVYDSEYPAYELRVPDQYRTEIFLRRLAEYEQNNDLPRLVMILLPQDHTSGTSPDFPTPRAMNADNDLAVGRVIEAISKSKYWNDSAIFITEDDSQDGVDHVDGHRTVGMVISPYARRGAVDSHLYSIINMYRTIEQILGLPPQNQFDSAAEPMYSAFTATPDYSPYVALPNRIPLDEMNPSMAGLTGLQRSLAEASSKIDTGEPDTAPADMLNRAIWYSVKGFATPYNYGR